MKFMHIALNNTLARPELANLQTQFWSNHTFPTKPIQDDVETDAAFDARFQAYKASKYQLQDDWINTLEVWTAGQIAKAMQAVKYDPTDTNCLYVFTLPEGYWHDIEPAGKTHISAGGSPVYKYSNPLYEATASNILTGRHGYPGVLASITRKNLMIFAGTIWWKDTTGPVEILYNTAPVFHDEKCVFAWEKQLLTEEDGLGRDSQNPADKLHKWVDGRKVDFATASIPGAAGAVTMDEINGCAEAYMGTTHRGYLSPLAAHYNAAQLPSFTITAPANVSFGIDICADFITGVSSKLLSAPPDIQIVPASGVSFRYPESYYARKYHCFCDLQGAAGTLAALSAAERTAACAGMKPFQDLSHPSAGTLFNVTDQLPL